MPQVRLLRAVTVDAHRTLPAGTVLELARDDDDQCVTVAAGGRWLLLPAAWVERVTGTTEGNHG